ncbi:MAG TPA: RluA family pseudouridine synthase [Candidatus Poseidoniales archaeon]|jgi:23S rRNA pseudouridine1911/1915/1917 synthase|nr:MAG: RluA family pseudouridine synthase [Euryarchaeota archaeon]HIF45773.1 RluA family pseudouridine synthase [Candidatus Poseidoniales archaeon]HIL65572.1 RluA family pseudouridine synthase [Candidatus Poseidoniales archaeon]
MKLIDEIQKLFPNSSRNTLRKMLTGGRVLVNGKTIHKATHLVESDDEIEITDKIIAAKTSPPPIPKKKTIRIKILFEDEHLLVVNKQAGLLSVATDKMEPDTLHSRTVDYLKDKNEKNWGFIVHRLDRETSGVMIFAKHKHHKEYLQEQFAAREVHRIYHALVEGGPEERSGTIQEWLLEDKFLRVKAVNKRNPNAREAITHWNVVDSDESASLIQLTIETGRRHQIRVGLANLGCPVIGDKQHGARGNPIGRIALHATSLEFLHPETDDPVRFEAPIPFGPEN